MPVRLIVTILLGLIVAMTARWIPLTASEHGTPVESTAALRAAYGLRQLDQSFTVPERRTHGAWVAGSHYRQPDNLRGLADLQRRIAAAATTPPPVSKATRSADPTSWLPPTAELLFAWPCTETSLATRGTVRIHPASGINLNRGAVLLNDANATVLASCQLSDELSLALDFTTPSVNQHGPARIVTFSASPDARNFTLGQEYDELILRLRTTKNNLNGTAPQLALLDLDAGVRHQIVLTYRPGRLIVDVDGHRTLETNLLQGNFGNWSPQHLLLGDEWTGQRNWQGTVHRIAIYSRLLGDDDAKAFCADSHRSERK